MSLGQAEALQRLFTQWKRDLLANAPPEQRAELQKQLDLRERQLLARAGDGATTSLFSDLMGLGTSGAPSFENISKPQLVSDRRL